MLFEMTFNMMSTVLYREFLLTYSYRNMLKEIPLVLFLRFSLKFYPLYRSLSLT